MAYLKEEDLKETYNDHKSYMSPLFQPFDEFERIARNKPHGGIAKGLPRVTDGTLSALIQEQPKRIIQQIPTGKVKAKSKWLEIVATYILENEILPNNNMVAALIQKCWALTSKTLTYGAQPVMVQFVKTDDYTGTDFVLPYVKDVFLEPGKLSDKDSNCIFVRAWYRPGDLDRIIEKEKQLAKAAKERGEKYESTWDIEVLERAKQQHIEKEKEQEAQTANEKDKNTKQEVIEMVHAFQRGIGQTFYSFFPDLPDDENICRRKVNKDPRGVIPIHFMYANVDLSNALGRGSVELSGGMQNLLDSEVQSYQYMRALLMNPPLVIKGNVRSSVIKYAPAAHIKLGADPNASVETLDLSTSSLESFPNNYGLIKSQILNLNSSVDTSVSAEVGNPGYSKTPAGISAQEEKLGVSDNYMRKQFESTFEEILETQINLYFAERQGIHELQLDQDTADKLRKIDPQAVSPENMIRINYSTETEKLKFQVDASTSSMKDDAAERDRLVELLGLAGQYPMFAELIGKDGTQELINRIIIKSGVENPEKIMPSTEQEVDEQGNPIEKPSEETVTPEMVQEMVQMGIEEAMKQQGQDEITKQLLGKFDSLPEDSKKAVLEQLGLPANEISPKQEELNIKKFDVAANQAGQTDEEFAESDANREQSDKQAAMNMEAKQQSKDSASKGSKTQPKPKEQPVPTQASEPVLEPELPPQPEPTDPALQDEAGLDEEDILLIEGLKERGFDDEIIAMVVHMLRNGATEEDVLAAIQQQGAVNG